MNHKRFSTEEELVFLDEVISNIREGVMSYRKGAQHLREVTGKIVSHEGLRKMVLKSLEEVDAGADEESLGD